MKQHDSWIAAVLGEHEATQSVNGLRGGLAEFGARRIQSLLAKTIRYASEMQAVVLRRAPQPVPAQFDAQHVGAVARRALLCVDADPMAAGLSPRTLERRLRWGVYELGAQLIGASQPLNGSDYGTGPPPFDLPSLSDAEFMALVLRIAAFSIDARLRVPVSLSWIGYSSHEISRLFEITPAMTPALHEQEQGPVSSSGFDKLISAGHHAIEIELALRTIAGRRVDRDSVAAIARRVRRSDRLADRYAEARQQVRREAQRHLRRALGWLRRRSP